MTRAAPCVGCLGSAQCWICSGDGCHRCVATGACHLCVLPAARQTVLDRLVPRQPTAQDSAVRG